MKMMEKQNKRPDWADKAETSPYKPSWTPKIPYPLWSLGEKFFPIPSGRKGYPYPHHKQEFRYLADSETLNAYLESGWGYGIACGGNLVVVDIDEKRFVDEITSKLPATAYQWTGSREGVHLFYLVSGLNTREILHFRVGHDCSSIFHDCRKDNDGECMKDFEYHHLGEVKCDPHGYVVGPGSLHPSGNKYGPLEGDEITELDKSDLMDVLEDYIKPSDADRFDIEEYSYIPEGGSDNQNFKSKNEFHNLTADDVVPWLEPGKRVPHPGHGSSTGNNFMKNDDAETFTCWRHDYGGSQGCGLSPQHLLAQMETGIDCDRIRNSWSSDYTLHYKAWKRAVSESLVSVKNIPYTVLKGYAESRGLIERDEKVQGDMFWDVRNALICEMSEPLVPTEEI